MFNLNISGYVYKVTNQNGEFYIGSRTFRSSRGIIDIGKSYFSGSSNLTFVRDFRENPNQYEIEILHSGPDFTKFKADLLREVGIHFKNDKSLNLRYFGKVDKSNLNFRLPTFNRKRSQRLSNVVKTETSQKLPRVNLLTKEEKLERKIHSLKIQIADSIDKLVHQKRTEINLLKSNREKMEGNLSLTELKQMLQEILPS